MHSLVEFVLICYGMTHILALGRVFKAIRPDYYMFSCPMCVGCWVGVLVKLMMLSAPVNFDVLITAFFYGCISSGTSYFIIKLVGTNGLNISITRKEAE